MIVDLLVVGALYAVYAYFWRRTDEHFFSAHPLVFVGMLVVATELVAFIDPLAYVLVGVPVCLAFHWNDDYWEPEHTGLAFGSLFGGLYFLLTIFTGLDIAANTIDTNAQYGILFSLLSAIPMTYVGSRTGRRFWASLGIGTYLVGFPGTAQAISVVSRVVSAAGVDRNLGQQPKRITYYDEARERVMNAEPVGEPPSSRYTDEQIRAMGVDPEDNPFLPDPPEGGYDFETRREKRQRRWRQRRERRRKQRNEQSNMSETNSADSTNTDSAKSKQSNPSSTKNNSMNDSQASSNRNTEPKGGTDSNSDDESSMNQDSQNPTFETDPEEVVANSDVRDFLEEAEDVDEDTEAGFDGDTIDLPGNLYFNWEQPPETRFEDIGGYDSVKEDLEREVVNPLLSDGDAYERFGVEPSRGLLFHGPPGTGKTLFARALANSLGLPFAEMTQADLTHQHINKSPQLIKRAFEEAQALGGVLFIDEAEQMFQARGDRTNTHAEDDKVVNTFLTELTKEDKDFILILTTNRKDRMDEAILRPGRIDAEFEIDLPDVDAREKILTLELGEVPNTLTEENIEQVAQGTDEWSGADLAALANKARLSAAERNTDALEWEDLRDAYAEIYYEED